MDDANRRALWALLTRVATYDGHIVSTSRLTDAQIRTARAEGRMWVDDDGLGFVYQSGCPHHVEVAAQSAPTLGAYVDRCVAHALTKLCSDGALQPLSLDDCDARLFPQTWGSTACGWGGVAGQAFTTAYTVVVLGPCGDAVVYLGRPAYYLPTRASVHADERESFDAMRERFRSRLAACSMPAVNECTRIGCRRMSHGNW